TPNRAGSENTPAPTIPPTTIAVSVGTVIFATVLGADSTACTVGEVPGVLFVLMRSPHSVRGGALLGARVMWALPKRSPSGTPARPAIRTRREETGAFLQGW